MNCPKTTGVVIETYRCRQCQAEIFVQEKRCPRCRLPVAVQADAVAAEISDVLLGIGMALVALATTLPLSYLCLEPFFSTSSNHAMAGTVALVSAWNLYILGIPLLTVTGKWWSRIRKGRFEHARMWREYWIIQTIVLTPVWILALLIGMVAILVS